MRTVLTDNQKVKFPPKIPQKKFLIVETQRLVSHLIVTL